jgi:phosphoribosylaminoimidazole carboxylase
VVNILGAHSGTIGDTMIGINTALRIPRTTVHWYGKDGCRAGRKMGHVNVTADNTEELDSAIAILLAAENVSETIIPPVRIVSSQIDVGVIMGSTSDLPTMQEAVLVLKKFGISYEVDIVSAHRTPDKLVSYGRSAVSRGLKVIIAGAGGAAHLPGMIAALTPLPVIGVPIKTSTLNGQDSLLSIVQMPKGVPVATVAIGNAANAGLLAARILGCCQPDLLRKMESYQAEMESMVNSMSEKLLKIGSDEYLAQMENKSHSVNI